MNGTAAAAAVVVCVGGRKGRSFSCQTRQTHNKRRSETTSNIHHRSMTAELRSLNRILIV
jgi:hypothetical protein